MGSQSSISVPVISRNHLVSEKPDGLPAERYLPVYIVSLANIAHLSPCPPLFLSLSPASLPKPVPRACPCPVRGPVRSSGLATALCEFLFILLLVLFFLLHACMFVCGQRRFVESVVSTMWVPGIQPWGSKNLHRLRHVKNIQQRGWRHSPGAACSPAV